MVICIEIIEMRWDFQPATISNFAKLREVNDIVVDMPKDFFTLMSDDCDEIGTWLVVIRSS